MVRGGLFALAFVGCGRAFFQQEQSFDGSTDAQLVRSLDAAFDTDVGDRASGGPTEASVDAILEAGNCQSTTIAIASDEDDGEIDLDSNSFLTQGEGVTPEQDVPGIYMGYWDFQEGGLTWGYFRFQLPAGFSSGASVRRAHLILHGAFAIAWMPASYALTLYLEQSPDAPVVTSASNAPFGAMGRRVGTPTRWPETGGLDWQIDQPNQSPDVTAALQDLVDNTTVADGAHIQFWLSGDQLVRTEVSTFDFGRANGQPAQFFVEWCP